MAEPCYRDVFDQKGEILSKADKICLLTEKWNADNYSFPARYNGGSFRKAQSTWFKKYDWARYSTSTDGVFCATCFLFGESRVKALAKTTVSDWSNMIKILGKHVKTSDHVNNTIAADNFMAITRGVKKDIENQISFQYNLIVEKNRQILTGIVEAIIFCGKQNIPLRGHNEDKGNFHALLQLQAKYNPIMKEHIETGDPRTLYTSPTIQNELICIIGGLLVENIVQACNSAGFYGFIADEATDAATIEHMALCVRFVEGNKLREDFLGFAECNGTTGEALATAFLQKLRDLGLTLENMRAQGYDGASNMSGIYRGVQARVRQIVPSAIYSHCKAHCLNLAIIHSCKVGYIRNMMDVVQTVAFAFNYSAKRLLKFTETLEADPISKENMMDRKRLQSLCETRWAARADALHTFVQAYRTVVASLETLEQGGDTKAAGYRLSVLQFSFIVTLVTSGHVLSGLVSLSTMLQKKECDLLQAVTETKVVIRMLQNERNDDAVWDELYEKAVTLARDVDIEPAMARNIGLQRNRANAPAQTTTQFWKINMYLPFVDHLISELEARMLQGSDRFKAQWLIPSNVQESLLPEDRCVEVFDIFQQDLDTDQITFMRECAKWRTWWTDPELAATRPEAPADLSSSLLVAKEDSYPCIRTIFKLLMIVFL